MRVPAAVAAVAVLLAGCTSGRARTSSETSAAKAPPAYGRTPRWVPAPGVSWQWQLTTPVDMSVDAAVYDIDGVENDASVVRELHRRGRRAICYVNVGAAEDFRPDFGRFPRVVLGRRDGWRGERWLDIRRIDVLGPIMAARFDQCRAKGFDAVEPDLVDGHTETTGFRLTAADQLAYNRFVASLAHERGMSVGLKNDLEQVPRLLAYFDFAIDEQCAQERECKALTPFVRAGKAVLHVEYTLPRSRFCAETRALGFSSMRKRPDLGAWRRPC